MDGRYYPVRSYEVQQWHLQYDDIALRQLLWEGRGKRETTLKLRDWCHYVLGKPYHLTLAKVAERLTLGWPNGSSSSGDGDAGAAERKEKVRTMGEAMRP